MFANIRLKKILIVSNATFAAITLLLALSFVLSLQSLDRGLTDIAGNTVPSVDALLRIKAGATAVARDAAKQPLFSGDAATKVGEDIDNEIATTDADIAHYRQALVSDDKDSELFQAAERQWAALKNVLPAMRRAVLANDGALARDIYARQIDPATNGLGTALDADLAYNRTLADRSVSKANGSIAFGRVIAIGFTIAGAIIAALLT